MDSSHVKKIIIVMGVSGSGKSTLANRLATELSVPFIEADDYHSIESKTMMSTGIAITEEQRLPWVMRLCEIVKETHREHNLCVLAFSGLKAHHRQMFRELGVETWFVFLNPSFSTIEQRLKERQGHFFDPALLSSQFEDLEIPSSELGSGEQVTGERDSAEKSSTGQSFSEQDVIVIDNSFCIENSLAQILSQIEI